MEPSHEHPDTGTGDLGVDPVKRTAVLRASAEACRARNYNEEGIPMILVLERVDGEATPGDGPMAGDSTIGTSLARAFEMTLDAIAPGPEPSPAAIALTLEVVAARWFTLGVPERP